MPEIWRVDRSVGRTIYRQAGDEPSKADELIGVMDTPALAALACAAVNTIHHMQAAVGVTVTVADGSESRG